MIKLIQSYKVGAFLAEEDATPIVVETSSAIQPPPGPLILPGIAGAASAETFKMPPNNATSPLLAPTVLSGVPEGARDVESSKVIAALVGTRSVANVIKTLQQVRINVDSQIIAAVRNLSKIRLADCDQYVIIYNLYFFSNLTRPKLWIAVTFLLLYQVMVVCRGILSVVMMF